MWQLHQWRIDDHYKVFRHVLVSKNIATPDQAYGHFSYYRHDFADDQERVSKTFQELCRLGAPMIETPNLSFLTVLDVTSRHQDIVAIMLLDNNILRRTEKMMDNTSNTCQLNEYAGHYVILCGTSDNTQHIQSARTITLYDKNETYISWNKEREFCCVLANPDPSSLAPYMFVMPEHLEAAWRTVGTDDDIIFLRKCS
jgi:Guanylylate cyclase